MTLTPITFTLLAAALLGIIIFLGAAIGGAFAFAALLIILAYRQYTSRSGDTKTPRSSKAGKAAGAASPKPGAVKAAPKKPVKAPPKKLPTYGSTGSPSARPTAPVQTKPSTWKAPPRR